MEYVLTLYHQHSFRYKMFVSDFLQVTEDDHDWTSPNGRTHKLRSKKGRSIVHKNLEDNYGAVIVANHEALAQVLENVWDKFYSIGYFLKFQLNS